MLLLCVPFTKKRYLKVLTLDEVQAVLLLRGGAEPHYLFLRGLLPGQNAKRLEFIGLRADACDVIYAWHDAV